MHDTLSVSPKQFTPATSAMVIALRLQNLSPHGSVFLQVTATNTIPTDLRGAVELGAGQTLATDLPLYQLFPGMLAHSAGGYVWVWANNGATISVSHA